MHVVLGKYFLRDFLVILKHSLQNYWKIWKKCFLVNVNSYWGHEQMTVSQQYINVTVSQQSPVSKGLICFDKRGIVKEKRNGSQYSTTVHCAIRSERVAGVIDYSVKPLKRWNNNMISTNVPQDDQSCAKIQRQKVHLNILATGNILVKYSNEQSFRRDFLVILKHSLQNY